MADNIFGGLARGIQTGQQLGLQRQQFAAQQAQAKNEAEKQEWIDGLKLLELSSKIKDPKRRVFFQNEGAKKMGIGSDGLFDGTLPEGAAEDFFSLVKPLDDQFSKDGDIRKFAGGFRAVVNTIQQAGGEVSTFETGLLKERQVGAEQAALAQAAQLQGLQTQDPEQFVAIEEAGAQFPEVLPGGIAGARRELLGKAGVKGVEILGKEIAPVSGREKAATKKIRTPDGKIVEMQFNPITERFDILVGEAPASFRDELKLIDKQEQIIKNFNADPTVRRGESMITSANTIIDAVASNNPVANASLPTLMARASGEVGNLSEADKAPFGGSRALQARMKQVATELATGLRTEENLKFIEELAVIFKSTGQRAKTRIAKERSKQFSKVRGSLFAEEEILGFLAPQFVLEQAKGEDFSGQSDEEVLKGLGL